MGQQFARVRQAKGLTQKELARRSGVRLRSLQEWEQGTRIPRFDRAVQLAEGLGVSLDELAGRAAGTPHQTEKGPKKRGRRRE
jgi:transcriptional regulator with XRE-family HTH domain